MSERTDKGIQWVNRVIHASVLDDVQIQWEKDDYWSPPDALGQRWVKEYYRVEIVAPGGKRDTERIIREDLDDCADDTNAEVRGRVKQQIKGWLHRLGIAK